MKNLTNSIEILEEGISNIMGLADIASKNCQFGEGLPKKVILHIIDEHVFEIICACWRLKAELSEVKSSAYALEETKTL